MINTQFLYKSIINSSEDAIISKTFDGIITTWNPSAENIYGFSAVESMDKHISIIIPPNRLAELQVDDKLKLLDYSFKNTASAMSLILKDGSFLDFNTYKLKIKKNDTRCY
jgi:PAS domain-containing protein